MERLTEKKRQERAEWEKVIIDNMEKIWEEIEKNYVEGFVAMLKLEKDGEITAMTCSSNTSYQCTENCICIRYECDNNNTVSDEDCCIEYDEEKEVYRRTKNHYEYEENTDNIVSESTERMIVASEYFFDDDYFSEKILAWNGF